MMKIQNLSKSFKNKRKVLDSLHMTIDRGNLVHLKGPNGSGKTTFLKIISGILLPDSGSIFLDEVNLINLKQKKGIISLVSNNPRSFFMRLSAKQNLEFFGSMGSLRKKELSERIEELSDAFSSNDLMDLSLNKLSSGQMQKINIMRGYLLSPDVILFDEAFDSLDVDNKNKLLDYTKKYVHIKDSIVIICSHSEFKEGTVDKVINF